MYAEERLAPIEALREMGYTTDQAIKIAIMFELREISDVLGSPEYGDILRTKRRGAKLQKYCEEYLSAVTVPHVGVRGFHYTWTSEVEREAIKEYEKSRGIL